MLTAEAWSGAQVRRGRWQMVNASYFRSTSCNPCKTRVRCYHLLVGWFLPYVSICCSNTERRMNERTHGSLMSRDRQLQKALFPPPKCSHSSPQHFANLPTLWHQPVLSPSLPPCLPLSLPPSRPSSLVLSLPPSLPPSLSLPHSPSPRCITLLSALARPSQAPESLLTLQHTEQLSLLSRLQL
jgi:hypothetical protein